MQIHDNVFYFLTIITFRLILWIWTVRYYEHKCNHTHGLSITYVFYSPYYVSLRSEFLFVISITISTCSVRLYFQLFVGVICVCLHILVVSNTYCVVFLGLFVFILCIVYPLLSVSRDCPFKIAPSVFYDVYSNITVCVFWIWNLCRLWYLWYVQRNTPPLNISE